MNLLFAFLSEIAAVFLFQKLSTEEGVPYTPQDAGPGWLLYGAVVLVLVAVVFVLIKVFRGMQRSRDSEVEKERSGSARTPEK